LIEKGRQEERRERKGSEGKRKVGERVRTKNNI
jgi:hypothetical protein